MLASLFPLLNTPLEPIPTSLEPRLPRLDAIKAVIWDVYGTLIISGTGDISIAQTIDRESELRAILSRSGYTVQNELSLSEIFYSGIKKDHARAKSAGIDYPEVDILEIWSGFFDSLLTRGILNSVPEGDAIQEMALRFECAVNPVWPMPGLVEVLKELKDRSLPSGIVSNAQFYTPLMLEGFTGQPLGELGFNDKLCIWSYRERLGKPSIQLFEKLEKALAESGIAPRHTLYVGNDMLNDIWTANQTGFRTALFAGDRRSLRLRESDPRCRDLRADAVFTALPQLWSIL